MQSRSDVAGYASGRDCSSHFALYLTGVAVRKADPCLPAGLPNRFLVATSRSILLVDPRAQSIKQAHVGDGLYYGIDIAADRIFVAARRRMVSSRVPVESERGTILVFDFDLKPMGEICADFPLRDIHQIRHFGDALYVTCSYDNMIAVRERGAWRQWYPLGMPACEPRDINHFNTIEQVDGLVCIVAHNKGDSEILMFDRATHTLRRRLQLGVQAHNVWKQRDEWCTCSSAEGRLIGSRGFEVATGGFPRGVWIGADCAVVGISQLAERSERDFTSGELIVYDAGWNECYRMVFEGEGLILDVVPWR